jgi:hypothetical protein
MLGQQNPVTANSPPAQGGLSVLGNPLAQQLQAQGRDEDSMLVHMTPDEVGGLQQLAMAHGGSLTINPVTGLPEAFFLKKLLPTILGAALAATGVGAPLAAGIVGLGSTAATGSLRKGLMAGLGAFGGASLAGAAGLGGSISKNAFGALGDKAGILGANMGAGAATAAPGITTNLAAPAADAAASANLAMPITETLATGPITLPMAAPSTGATGFFGKFAETARQGLPGGMIGKAAPAMAGLGVLNAASAPSGMQTSSGQIDNSYQGPYTAQQRKPVFAENTSDILGSSKERDYFPVDVPEIYAQGKVVQPGTETAPGTPILRSVLNPKAKKNQPRYSFEEIPYMGGRGYNEGGVVHMEEGGFVVPARAVAEGGGGYTEKGFERFAKLGGIPLRGPGDGVSDDIPARIGNQPARVAAGEVYMPPEAVRRAGGASKLYAMVERAHKAHKRGQDSSIAKGLRKGLA